MFAYKATKKDMTCLNFQYELGKLYEFNNELKLCEKGFHFCKNLKNIHNYYSINNKTHRYFLVEIPDDAQVIDSEKEYKSVTNKIRFVRELTEQDWIDNEMIRELTDKTLHYKDSNGIEEWYGYDDKGKIIHFKDSNGIEEWWEYNEQGKVIHFKNSNGREYWYEYNDQGDIIYRKTSNGLEEWWEYDDQGNMIHFKDSNGFERWYEYDDQGIVIHQKYSK